MGFVAVLDACVLYPASLRDVLLRLADAEFYDLRWSARILEEVERNLAGRVGGNNARKVRAAMEGAFDEAEVEAAAVDRLEPAMTTDPKDRHVLAAAVAGDAQVVVTSNLRDFPPSATEPFAIEAQHPDEFLMTLFGLNGGLVADVVERQAGALRNPPLSVDEVLAALHNTVPDFAAAVTAELARRSGG